MRTLASDQAERLGAITVDLDPEHVEIGDRAQDFEIALGAGVEVEIQQQIDIGPRALADRLEMHAEIAQHMAVDVALRIGRRAEAGAPALRVLLVVVVDEDVGLHGREALFTHLAADRLHPLKVVDRRLEVGRMIDAPGCAVRPVDPDTVADLAAQKLVARDAERLGLGVEKRVLDGAQSQGNDAAGGRPRDRIKLRVDPLVIAHRLTDDASRELLDRRADARRAKTFVVLAPADDAVLGGDLDEVVVAEARIGGERLDRPDLGIDLHRDAPPTVFDDYTSVQVTVPQPSTKP